MTSTTIEKKLNQLKISLGGRALIWRHPASLIFLDGISAACILVVIGSFGFSTTVPTGTGLGLLSIILFCNAITGQYQFETPRGWLNQSIRSICSLALTIGAAAIFIRRQTLSSDLLTAFFTIYFITHVLIRHSFSEPFKRESMTRWALMGASVIYLFQPFLTRGSLGAGDGYWYSVMVADFVSQWRAGIFPAFVGQTEFAFNGAVFPHRFAPFLQHAAGMIDLVTWRQLSPLTLLNLVLFLSASAGLASAYFCVLQIRPDRPWVAAALAMLYVASPGVLALAYTGGMFMSVTTLPFVPLVLLGAWRAGNLRSTLPIASCVAPLAAAWLCHPPIALWLHAIFSGALTYRWFRLWRAPWQITRETTGICVLFALLSGFTFVSALTIGAGGTNGDRTASLNSIVQSFPSVLNRVSESADQTGDYQLGWSLWAVLGTSAFYWILKREIQAGLLLASALAMIVLLLPMPWITGFVWAHLPQLVIDATFHWPMQRLALIFASITAVTAAATWPATMSRKQTILTSGLLCAGVLWSHWEAGKFLSRGRIMLISRPAAEKELNTNNALLTRYAFLRFPAVPAYFSHGFVDPVLEHRVLSSNESRVLVSNRNAVLSEKPTIKSLRNEFDGVQGVILKPDFKITPGVRHYLRFEWLASPIRGSIVARSASSTRVYALPDTGLGMDYETKSRAFGLMLGNTDGFPIWIQGDTTEALDLRFMLAEPPTYRPPRDFLRIFDYSYRPDQLPIRVHTFAPYRVSLKSPEAGLLETPRVFVAGYRANVNGQGVEAIRSTDGLVAIPVPAGPSEVTLSYPGRPLLQISYWLSIATWFGLFIWLIACVVRPRELADPVRSG